MIDTQSTTEIKPGHYFVAPQFMEPLTKKVAPDTAFIKADPTSKDSWPAGAPVLIPSESMSGAHLLSVSKPEGKNVVVQVFEVVKTADGRLALKPSTNADATQIARNELDIFSVMPPQGEERLAAMRRLQPGNSVIAENRAAAHVQLLPTHPSAPGTKIQFGMVTPADLERFQKSPGYVAPKQGGAILSRIQQNTAQPGTTR